MTIYFHNCGEGKPFLPRLNGTSILFEHSRRRSQVSSLYSHIVFFFSILCAVTLFSPSAWSACGSPSGDAGKMVYNSDYHVVQYCDGTNWIETGRALVSGTSDCSNPTRSPGTIIYNSDYSVMQYCNGAVWVSMGTIPFPLGDLGKLAHWHLNETSGTTAYDSIGAYDGTLVNGPTWDSSGGQQGGAVVLDGTNDYVSVPYNSNLDNAQFTVMMWVNPDVLEANALFRGPSGIGWAPGGGYRIRINGSTGGVSADCNDGSTNYGASKWYVHQGEWNLVVVTYDGTSLRTYVNDLENPAVAAATCSQLSTNDIYFGNSNGVEEFDGKIDDVMLFDNALTQDELNNAYVASGTVPSPPTSGLIGYWKMDESGGTTAKDSSGSGLDGTLVNGPTWTSTGGVVKGAIHIDDATAMAVEIPYKSGIEPTTGVTYSAWVYLTSNNWYEVIINHKRDNDILRITNAALPQFILKINGTVRTLTASSAMSFNRWYHIAGTYDGSEMALYVDGEKVSSAAYTGNIFTWSRGWEIGTDGEFYIAGETIEGYLDEVRIYNRGLSDAEIRQLRLYREYRPTTSCTSPSGSAGDMVYNSDYGVMQYCNGWTWVGIGKNLPPCGMSPTPGDVCSDGTVYAGDLSGKRLYVAPVMNSLSTPWNNGTNGLWQTTGATSTTNGASNTMIINQWTGSGAPLMAGQLCADYDAYSHNDWYLPARDEFQILYDNRTAINSGSSENFDTTGKYWTSTEMNGSVAVNFNWPVGAFDTSAGKHSSFRIRCVRSQ